MINSNHLLAYLEKIANVNNEIALISESNSVITYDRILTQTFIFSIKGLSYESYDTLNVHMNTAFDQYLQEAYEVYTKGRFKTSTWVRYPDRHNSFAHYALLQRASDINDPLVDPIAICLVTQTDLSIIIHFIDRYHH